MKLWICGNCKKWDSQTNIEGDCLTPHIGATSTVRKTNYDDSCCEWDSKD